MHLDYVKFGRLCAAIYPFDNNWHRCKIIFCNNHNKTAKVNFIDYGGDSNVDYKDLKFLHNRFGSLPVQAVTCHFFNIKEATKSKWPKDVVNYLLNLVLGKRLEAEVMGVNSNSVALEIYEHTVVDGEVKWMSLNQKLIADGYERYDETRDPSVNFFCCILFII